MADDYLRYGKKFKTLLAIQLVLILMAGAAFIYISSGTYRKIGEYRDVLAKIEQAKREHKELKQNIEKLYSVKVTPQSQVYELKATAKATGKIFPSGKPEYQFRVYVNSPPELLQNIVKVTYDFNHESFGEEKHQEATDPTRRFDTRYSGYGCLTSVTVKVFLRDGTEQSMDFNMCKSIGWD